MNMIIIAYRKHSDRIEVFEVAQDKSLIRTKENVSKKVVGLSGTGNYSRFIVARKTGEADGEGKVVPDEFALPAATS